MIKYFGVYVGIIFIAVGLVFGAATIVVGKATWLNLQTVMLYPAAFGVSLIIITGLGARRRRGEISPKVEPSIPVVDD